jgi:hypothetical protein
MQILHTTLILRERQEDRIFRSLLKLCHGLEDRLADAEPEEVQMIGDLVCVHILHSVVEAVLLLYRYRKVLTLLVPTTRRE